MRPTVRTGIRSMRHEQDVWGYLPEVPMHYVVATGLMSAALLSDGQSLSARSRGTNALAAM